MNTRSVVVFGALSAAVFSFFPHAAPAPAAVQAAGSSQYRCPMHPTVLQDGKGDCPICGMKLVPVSETPKSAGSPAGLTSVAADKQKVLGIVVETATRSGGSRTLRVPGRVVPDETRVYRVTAGIEGAIRDASTVTTGSRVKQGQLLGTYFAPNALSVIQLYLLSVNGRERAVKLRDAGTPAGESVALGNSNIQQRVLQLENYGVSALQREEMARTASIPDTVKIFAPVDGWVLARNLAPGLKFERGFEFYRIADLRRVWILADVFPQDARHVRPGMRARISIPEQAPPLQAKVAEILPQFDPSTRTLKVRLELDNPGYRLRPEMLVDVRFDVALAPALVVPADAVVDSGLVKTVYVESAEGSFAPRAVETGWRNAGLVEIVEGLSPGERIVTSGTFFLDSESRMRTPVPGVVATRATAPAPTGHEAHSSGGAGPDHPEAAPAGAGERR